MTSLTPYHAKYFAYELTKRYAANSLQKFTASLADAQVDTAYISKMENNEKPVSRIHLKKLSQLFKVSLDELLTIWLADKLYDVVKDEDVALKAMQVAEDEVKRITKKRK